LSKNYYLTGGTALSEYYLHHRLSEDLDFFSENETDRIWLNTLAKKISRLIEAKNHDIQESFNRNLVFFTTIKETIKTEFTYYPFTQIEKPKTIFGIKIDSEIDIAVNKFFTVYQKPTARHFIDLYLILTTKNYKWNQLEQLARVKFDTVIDPIQLGSQLIKAETVSDLPKMIIKLPENLWRSYFLSRAKELKPRLIK
jgi:predicted nucleotidyltransferase component of viral defense system